MKNYIAYITYDGILDPIGQSQVLSYLERIAKNNKIFLVSFEKENKLRQFELRDAIYKKIKKIGINWFPLRYHKNPFLLSTIIDILHGLFFVTWIIFRYRVCIIHARSYVPSVIVLLLKFFFRKIKYIFDMRGFWADERVDGGLWPADGVLYRTAKWFERCFLLNADSVVSLTQAAVDEMRTIPYLQGRMPNFIVITTCTDLEKFYPSAWERSTTDRSFTLGYVGSVGVWYLFEEVLKCFQILRRRLPEARLHILNQDGHDYIKECIDIFGIDPANVTIESVKYQEVAQVMKRMDAGIFFIKPTYSKKASTPTKLGEFLGCGVPCLSNFGIGDMSELLEREQIGVVIHQFSESEMRKAIDRLIQLTQHPEIKQRCRNVALRYFSLDDGVAKYQHIYDMLSEQ